MTNAIKNIKTMLAKIFSILLVAGVMAGCASVSDPGFEVNEPEETTVNSDAPLIDPMSGEMTPIITDAPSNQGR